MKKIKNILNAALCFAAAICLMAGCTDNEQQTAEDGLQAEVTAAEDNAEDNSVTDNNTTDSSITPEEDPEENAESSTISIDDRRSAAEKKARSMFTAITVKIAMSHTGDSLTDTVVTGDSNILIFDGKEYDTSQYLGENFTGHIYGEIDTDIGGAKYALWSEDPIPEEYRHQLTKDEKDALAEDGIIIGCYP